MPPTGCQRAVHCLWYTRSSANIYAEGTKVLQLTRGKVPNPLNLDSSIWYKVGVFKKIKLGMAYIHMVRLADIYVSILHLLTDGYPVPHWIIIRFNISWVLTVSQILFPVISLLYLRLAPIKPARWVPGFFSLHYYSLNQSAWRLSP